MFFCMLGLKCVCLLCAKKCHEVSEKCFEGKSESVASVKDVCISLPVYHYQSSLRSQPTILDIWISCHYLLYLTIYNEQ